MNTTDQCLPKPRYQQKAKTHSSNQKLNQCTLQPVIKMHIMWNTTKKLMTLFHLTTICGRLMIRETLTWSNDSTLDYNKIINLCIRIIIQKHHHFKHRCKTATYRSAERVTHIIEYSCPAFHGDALEDSEYGK